ncbi:MAG: TonB-dependent receptor [Geothrix sp.]|uniref:TonB-dependent receptor n=1 Tax=Geothrix sp. TaxID=1962974 RepID=UPI0017D8603E|nr:carboxypeptidase regulatory-like domain-containing protein [Geothrix sp.]NWJ39427.1 TonB-dependent receptor [Geothrix sp.]WIL19348.1 MAG: carboxypeptidase regulatory-like domain-containing protein [Geothrix sp.]
MRSRHLSSSSLVALLVAAAPLMAQGVSVQLGGRVLDTRGAAVAGATVVIRNGETGLTRTLQTSDEGRYLATLLPVGPYTVTVTKFGYQTAANIKVNLNLGDAAPLTIKLAPESGAVVEVVAATAQVDSERASAAAIVSPDNLTSLPVLNRSFTNLATLAPQVVVDSSRGNLAIAGQRGVNTSVNIDGGDNNEPFFGGATGAAEGKTPFTISIEAIREYQVITDGASAEFGRMGGGYVNAITKNGTNDLSGSLFYYQRPRGWVEAGPTLRQPNGSTTTNPVGAFQQEQFGFSIGGPIVKDKLFYFVAYDAQRKNSPINQVWGGGSPVVFTAADLANVNVQTLLTKSGNYSVPEDSDTYFIRFDFNPTVDHNIQFRVNHSKFKGVTGAASNAAYENLASDVVKTDAYVLQWNWVISGSWMNEFRASQTKDDMPRSTFSTLPEVSITSVGYYGAYPFDRTYNTKRTQIQENISYVTPTFQLKAGIDQNAIDVAEFFAGNWQGVYMFTSLANFEAGNWSTYRQNFGLSGNVRDAGQFATNYKQQAAFVQTDWRLSDSFKLGLGVRWDRQQNPGYPILDMSDPLAGTAGHAAAMPVTAKIPNDSQFSPRASFTWTPAFDQGKTVVRGSVGRYVSTTPAVFFYQVFAANGIRTGQVDFVVKPASGGNPAVDDSTTYGIPRGSAATNTGGGAFNAANPYWISSLPGGAALPKFNIWTFNPNFKNPYTDRANLGAERPFFQDLVLGFSATYAKSNQLERTADLNLGTPTLGAYGRLMYPTRPNTTYGTMGMYYSDATSLYHAYTASLKYHKEGSAFDAQLFYTYAINKDSDSNERNYSGVSIQDAGQLGKQWGYADTDRRQVLTGYFSFLDKEISGILASLSIRYQTGAPYTLLYTKDVNNDGNTSNDRYFANGVDSGRNTYRAGSQLYMDLGLRRDFQVTRKVKFTASMDIFNLLNRQDTYLSYRPNSGSTDAAPVQDQTQNWTGYSATNWPARQIQVGGRFAF